MKPFITLLKLSFKSLIINSTNMGGRKGKKSRSVTGVGALLLISGIFLYLSGMYSFMLGNAFAPVGGLDIMLALMMLMAMFWPLIFVLFAAQSLVFSTKDTDLVLSLPVSAFSVMLARVLALYLETLLMCELMLIPAGVAYIFYGGANGPLVLLLMVLLGVFFAFIPSLIALLFGSVVALVVSRLPFKNLFTVIFSLLFMVGIMAASFSISAISGGQDMASLQGFRDILFGIAPLRWAVQAVQGGLGAFLLFALAASVPFFVVVWVFSRFYKGMLTRLSSHRLRSDYTVRSLKVQGSFSALLAKETKRFFGTPAYLLNSGISILFMLVACVAAVIYKGHIDEFLLLFGAELFGVENAADVSRLLVPILLGVVCLMSAFIFVSCVSISLEGKTLWILKAAPVTTGKIFAAKAGTNFMLGAVTCLIAYPLLGYAFSLPALDVVMMIVLNLLFCLLTSVLGLYINLLLPRMDAENETMVIKQSASVLVATLVYVVVLAGFAGLYFLMHSHGFILFSVAAVGVLLLLNGGTLALLNTSGKKLFAAL